MRGIVLLALLPSLLGQDARQEIVYKMASKRNVLVTNEVSMGSGVIVKTGLVLTNNHILVMGLNTRVNGKLAELLARNTQWDLALLKVETVKVPDLRFDTKPLLLKQVFYVANPHGHFGLVSPGHILFADEDHICTNTLGMKGFSGGGLYNLYGELVGLNVGMEGEDGIGYNLPVHIPAARIKKFMEVMK